MRGVEHDRPCENPNTRIFRANYLLFFHFILYATISATVWFILSGIIVSSNVYKMPNHDGLNHTWLSVSGINACLTASLVAVRVTASSWSSIVAWRFVFLLIEKGGIDLRQLNSMISWKLLLPSPSVKSTRFPTNTSYQGKLGVWLGLWTGERGLRSISTSTPVE